MKNNPLIWRLMVGGVLVYAGFMKAVGPAAEFAAVMAAYKILPAMLITPLSVALPYVEMWIGLFILAGLYTRQASVAAAVLFSIFFIALASALLRRIDLASCGCFGPDTLSPRYTIILDIVLGTFSLVIYSHSAVPPPLSLDKALP
jgi:putative oxidoreductase